jgi:putative ABC transport system permease protein
VIGVLNDFNYESIHSPVEPLIIFLNKNWDIDFVYVKLNPIYPSGIIYQLDEQYKAAFGSHAMEWTDLDDRYMNLYHEDNRVKNVFSAGLLISVIVSCLGIFGMSALLMVRRTKEMGIRKVSGASQSHLFFLHLRIFLVLLAIAVVITAPAAFWLANRWLDSFAYHIDMSTRHFIVPALLTFLIVFITAGLHAWRGAKVNPAQVLKGE